MNTNPTSTSDFSPGTWSTDDANVLSSDFLELLTTFNVRALDLFHLISHRPVGSPSQDPTTPSAPPPIRGDGPITRTPLGVFLDSEIQATNSKKPPFRWERSEVDGSPVYRCECGTAIKRMGDLKRHWRSRLHGGSGFDCLKCGRSFSRRYMFNRHICRAKPATTQTIESMVDT